MRLHTDKLIQAGHAVARLDYSIQTDSTWNFNGKRVARTRIYFHVAGNPDFPVSGFLNMDESLANDLCHSFNLRHFGTPIPVRFVCSQTVITDTYLATVQSNELTATM
jgi:hypothetical protein